MRASLLTLSFGLSVLLCLSVSADEAGDQQNTDFWDAVRFNGYGTFRFGETDQGIYLDSDDDGSVRGNELALLAYYQPSERLDIGLSILGTNPREGLEAVVDLAFLRWRLTSSTSLEVGRSRLPVGFYSEYLRVGTLRPFLSLPQGIYGLSGIVADYFDGIKLQGLHPMGDWEISYDLYGGQMEVEHSHAFAIATGGDSPQQAEVSELVGARVVLSLPEQGLSMDLKALRGEIDHHGGPDGHEIYGLGLEKKWSSASARIEAVRHYEGEDSFDTVYVESDYHLNEHWQVALRWEGADLTTDSPRILADSAYRHRETSVGVNYWFRSTLVIKASVHDISGNLFSFPDPVDGNLEVESEDSFLTMIGVQFTF